MNLQIEAAAQGLIIYQGKPCRHKHDGLRYTASGNCVECLKNYNKKQRAKLRSIRRAVRK